MKYNNNKKIHFLITICVIRLVYWGGAKCNDDCNATPPYNMLDFNTKTFSCLDEIHTFLNPHKRHFYKDGDEAIFVHNAILAKIRETFRKLDIFIDEINIWEFTMNLGCHQYPMNLIWIHNESQSQVDFLYDLYSRSVYSFPWESTQSIYQPVRHFSLVEDFIRKVNLSKFIRKIRLDNSQTFSTEPIKIIDFDETVTKDALKPFRKILEQNQINSNHIYFITRAFIYLRPSYLNYLKIPFYNPDVVTQVLLLLDYHRTNIKRNREVFDIFDLIAMKLGIDDARLEYENCEFHKLIGKTLNRLSQMGTYIESNTFNLVEYCSGRVPWLRSQHIYQYLIYNFHQFFDQVITYSNTKTFKIKLSKIRSDHLIDHLANCKGWLTLDIDEADLNETSGDTLLQILTSSKIPKNAFVKIVWDTNYKWYYSGDHPTTNLNYQLKCITFSFYGTNKYNFIENFLNWLKLMLGPRCAGLNFEFYHTKIAHPFIFTNMYTNEIIFRSTTLTCSLINALKRCHTNRVLVTECRIQNDHNIIECLEGMDHVWRLYIDHEEHTFSIIVKYIEQQLETHHEFQFNKDIRISCFDYFESGMPNRLCLKDFKFYVNRERNKIETYHVAENKLVNLYDYLYLDKFLNANREYEQRDDFLFYQ